MTCVTDMRRQKIGTPCGRHCRNNMWPCQDPRLSYKFLHRNSQKRPSARSLVHVGIHSPLRTVFGRGNILRKEPKPMNETPGDKPDRLITSRPSHGHSPEPERVAAQGTTPLRSPFESPHRLSFHHPHHRQHPSTGRSGPKPVPSCVRPLAPKPGLRQQTGDKSN